MTQVSNEHVAYKRGKPHGQYGGTGNAKHGCRSHEQLLRFESSHMRERVILLQTYINNTREMHDVIIQV